jgi:hypothetical protein
MKILMSVSAIKPKFAKGQRVIVYTSKDVYKTGIINRISREGQIKVSLTEGKSIIIEKPTPTKIRNFPKVRIKSYTKEEMLKVLNLPSNTTIQSMPSIVSPNSKQELIPKVTQLGTTDRGILVQLGETVSNPDKNFIRITRIGEGFWRTNKSEKSFMPFPEEGNSGAFSKNLKEIQSNAFKHSERGVSPCRICGKDNGCVEYHIKTVYKGQPVELHWPEGYIHYLTTHKMKPSKEFKALIELGNLQNKDILKLIKPIKVPNATD